MGLSIGLEGFIIIAIDLHQGMGMGPKDRDVKEFSCTYVTGPASASNNSCTGSPNSRIHFVRSTSSELHQRFVFDHSLDPSGFCGNQGLEIDNIEEGRFNQLTLGKRSFYLDNRLIGKDQVPFFGRTNSQFHFEIFQVIQEGSFVA